MGSIFSIILAALVGGVIGAALVWWFSPLRHTKEQLAQERDAANHQLNRYRDEVDGHFLRTAELMKQFNHSYRMVHAQLAEGAQVLCSDSARRLALANSLSLLPESDNDDQPDLSISPPLDYAPSHKGTLSEEFGLYQQEERESLTTPRDYAEGCDDQGCSPDEEAGYKATETSRS